MKKIVSFCALVGALCAASPALAADLGGPVLPADIFAAPASGKSVNWTGVYIGGQVGYGNTNHKLTGDVYEPAYCDGAGDTEATCDGKWVPAETFASGYLDGLNSHGIFGGGTIGADYQLGRVVFGAFGDYNFSSIDTKAGASIDGTSVFSAAIEEGDSWLVAGRLGYLVGDRALIYVLGGYSQMDMKYKIAGEDDVSKTFSGWVLGAGGEYALTQNVFLGLEYQHFFGGKETLVDEDGFRLTDDVDADKVMAKLKVKLGRN